MKELRNGSDKYSPYKVKFTENLVKEKRLKLQNYFYQRKNYT